MPVRGVQHPARVQLDFSVTAEPLDGENIAVVQTPPVRGLAVVRNPNPVPARECDLSLLKHPEMRRVF